MTKPYCFGETWDDTKTNNKTNATHILTILTKLGIHRFTNPQMC